MIMKKVLSVVLVVMLALAAHAQKDVTKFLGIPVDGSKQAMIQKLKAKGYKYNSTYDFLEGEFNGQNVVIKVQTNNNKVWRIMMAETNQLDETNIKIRFNTLCGQFENNKKYVKALPDDYIIPDDERIMYRMSVDNKRYDAYFLQSSEKENDDSLNRIVWFTINEHLNKYNIIMFYENGCNAANGEDL